MHSQAPTHGQTAEATGGYIRQMPAIRNRWMYAARFIYWTLRHGSTEHAAWVVQNEGWKW